MKNQQPLNPLKSTAKIVCPLVIEAIANEQDPIERANLGCSAILLAGMFAGGFGIAAVIESVRYNNLVSQVEKIADTNKDGITTQSEWDQAYREMGVIKSPKNPYRLKRDPMEKYIQRHQNR